MSKTDAEVFLDRLERVADILADAEMDGAHVVLGLLAGWISEE